MVDDYVDFEVFTNETHAMKDQEILDSILSNDCAEEEEEKDKESEVNDVVRPEGQIYQRLQSQ